MQTELNDEMNRISFLIGTQELVEQLSNVCAMEPFHERMIEFLNEVSREVMQDTRSKQYSDVITFGFWIRKASLLKIKERFEKKDSHYRLGKGVVFHVGPANVPVNFAYSLVAGLLNGNANIVRVPSKLFPQVTILTEAFNKVLDKYTDMKPYIICVRYERNQKINDYYSALSDVRVVWGGDHTIGELRKSPLPPRSSEITFADRYSIAVIDAEYYLNIPNKEKVALDFYNDTFFSDQNACTSSRIIVWVGEKVEKAKEVFWKEAHNLVEKKYQFQPIQGVNKLTQCLKIATVCPDIKIEEHRDNRIIRVAVSQLSDKLMEYRENSGYFYEYDCKNISEIKVLCNDKRCQTVAYLGEKNMLLPLLKFGWKGIDRVVPMGSTMDFDLIWDGYDLSSQLTRVIVFR